MLHKFNDEYTLPFWAMVGGGQGPSGAQESFTRYTVDEDYQASLDVVSAMFSRLPSDWQSRYHEEVDGPMDGYMDAKVSRSYTALSSFIKTIAVEIGVEVEDVDVAVWQSMNMRVTFPQFPGGLT